MGRTGIRVQTCGIFSGARRFSISTSFDDERNRPFCGADTATWVSCLCTCAFIRPGATAKEPTVRPVLPSSSKEPWGVVNRPSESPRPSGRKRKTLQSPVELWWGGTPSRSAGARYTWYGNLSASVKKRQGWDLTSSVSNSNRRVMGQQSKPPISSTAPHVGRRRGESNNRETNGFR